MLETLGSSCRQMGSLSAPVQWGEVLEQLFLSERLRWLCCLSLTLRPVLQGPSPRSDQEQPCLGTRSKCPDGLVTLSATQTQTGAYSSVSHREGQNAGTRHCVTAVTPQDTRVQGPSTSGTGTFLTSTAQPLWLHEVSVLAPYVRCQQTSKPVRCHSRTSEPPEPGGPDVPF